MQKSIGSQNMTNPTMNDDYINDNKNTTNSFYNPWMRPIWMSRHQKCAFSAFSTFNLYHHYYCIACHGVWAGNGSMAPFQPGCQAN